MLVRAALRKISSLEATYGRGEPSLDYRDLVERADRVAVNHGGCAWVELKMYSRRRKTGKVRAKNNRDLSFCCW